MPETATPGEPSSGTVTVPLHAVAHARTGDKGNRLNASVIAFRPELFAPLVEQVTEDRVRALFAHRCPGRISRHVLPNLGALNFVIDDVLDGGVNQSLNLDGHGKTLSFLLLTLTVEIPEGLLSGTG
ncbi:hypothetical protein JL100_031450 (plasmid) [Skermanella mucosa]|uniref:AtuA-related protein n=1 Tax=Skermanella mucosa TaxID=1789672 RepID=UPI00192BFE26|nr:hypothetical protein [Skermanella mucosa]UEM24722.1 hypothetical protein JL100_031450 [Skermanella mucosa]